MNIMIKVIYNDRSEIHFHDGDTNERIFKQNIYYRVSECAEWKMKMAMGLLKMIITHLNAQMDA